MESGERRGGNAAAGASGATTGVGRSGEAVAWKGPPWCTAPSAAGIPVPGPPGRLSAAPAAASPPAWRMSAMQKDGFFPAAASRGKQPPAAGPDAEQYAADHKLKLEA